MNIRDFDFVEKHENIRNLRTDIDYVGRQTLHDILVDVVYNSLLKELEDIIKRGNFNQFEYVYVSNLSMARCYLIKGRTMIVNNGESYKPDITDKLLKRVIEIHVEGERKKKYFDLLPEGWIGLNVFYDEPDNEETWVVKTGSNNIAKINWIKNITSYDNDNIKGI